MNAYGRLVGLLGFAASLLVACAGTDTTGQGEDEIRRGKISYTEAVSLFSAVDDNCAGNDNGAIDTFAAASFTATAGMEKIRGLDRDASGVGCSADRVYSTSREQAAQMFEDHITSPDHYAKVCLEENLTSHQWGRLKLLIEDPTNLAVFASGFEAHSENANEEACSYWNFHVYRADGHLLKFTFNETD